MDNFASDFLKELQENILPFWSSAMPDPKGGFLGRIDGMGRPHPDSEKGAILNARILWTFSSAFRVLGRKEYRDIAGRAYDYIAQYFIDRDFGGVYWSLNPDGSPRDTKKQFYAIAFTVYALAEYYRACGCEQALCEAVSLFKCIEEHSLDTADGGYIEACTRDWDAIGDMRLSDKDQNDAKTMNTHLHILEAYTGLYRVWKDDSLAAALRYSIRIFLDRIIQKDGHLGLFFDEKWNSRSTMVSYGHDIEASWLMCEAAGVLGDEPLIVEVREASARMAVAAIEGFTPEGGMEYEYDPANGSRHSSRDWWVQAETVVGCVNQWQLTRDASWMERAIAQWKFIREHIVCPEGEWYWSALPHGHGAFVPNLDDDRAGFWKCPYHNGRMCMEIIERL